MSESHTPSKQEGILNLLNNIKNTYKKDVETARGVEELPMIGGLLDSAAKSTGMISDKTSILERIHADLSSHKTKHIAVFADKLRDLLVTHFPSVKSKTGKCEKIFHKVAECADAILEDKKPLEAKAAEQLTQPAATPSTQPQSTQTDPFLTKFETWAKEVDTFNQKIAKEYKESRDALAEIPFLKNQLTAAQNDPNKVPKSTLEAEKKISSELREKLTAAENDPNKVLKSELEKEQLKSKELDTKLAQTISERDQRKTLDEHTKILEKAKQELTQKYEQDLLATQSKFSKLLDEAKAETNRRVTQSQLETAVAAKATELTAAHRSAIATKLSDLNSQIEAAKLVSDARQQRIDTENNALKTRIKEVEKERDSAKKQFEQIQAEAKRIYDQEIPARVNAVKRAEKAEADLKSLQSKHQALQSKYDALLEGVQNDAETVAEAHKIIDAYSKTLSTIQQLEQKLAAYKTQHGELPTYAAKASSKDPTPPKSTPIASAKTLVSKNPIPLPPRVPYNARFPFTAHGAGPRSSPSSSDAQNTTNVAITINP